MDEQTGRIMGGRRWSDGLHQAVEAKGNDQGRGRHTDIRDCHPSELFQDVPQACRYDWYGRTEAGEFWSIYKLDVVVIPTNRPVIRDSKRRMTLSTRQKKAKYAAVINKIEELIGEGRPVLVGTTDVETSELLRAAPLRVSNIMSSMPKEHLKGGGDCRAGRPVQHRDHSHEYGGSWYRHRKLSPEVKKAGGLAIIGTAARHDSRRVDRQLRGRAGRQEDAARRRSTFPLRTS